MEIKIEIDKETAKKVLKAIRPVAEAIIKFTDKPETPKKKNEPVVQENQETEEPVFKGREYSFTEVRGILTEKSRAGFTDKVKELVNKYGNGKLSDVKPECYSDLIEEAELNCREPFTLEDIKEEVRKLTDDGFESSLKDLFKHHFATDTDNLKPEYYPSFMRDSWRLRNAGN